MWPMVSKLVLEDAWSLKHGKYIGIRAIISISDECTCFGSIGTSSENDW